MPLTDDFIKKVEIEYLRILANLLRDGKIDRQIARDSAKQFLTLLPFASSDDLIGKMQTFTHTFHQLAELYLFVVREIEEMKTQQVLAKMREMMKNNDIDNAINLIQPKE